MNKPEIRILKIINLSLNKCLLALKTQYVYVNQRHMCVLELNVV